MAKYRCGKCGGLGHNARSCKAGSLISSVEAPAVEAPAVNDSAVSLLSNGRPASRYQRAVFDFILNGSGNGVVKAVPGAGKTTTIVEVTNKLPTALRVIFVAFGNAIKCELERRVRPGVEVRTLHSFGGQVVRNAFGRTRIDEKKNERIARSVFPSDEKGAWQTRNAIVDCAGKVKSGLRGTRGKGGAFSITDAEILDVVDSYEIDGFSCTETEFCTHVRNFLVASAADRMSVHFDDMIWFPWLFDLRAPTFDLVLVDETQDLSPGQIDLVKRIGKGGRILAVGDPRQAIFAFAGAPIDTVDRLIDALDATVLPLSTCYRCARSIVAEAATIASEIEAAPEASEGIVRSIGLDKLTEQVKGGDFVISRTNAPLVSACFKLLAQGIPAYIMGQKIGEALGKFVKGSNARDVDGLLAYTEAWAEKECAKLTKRGKDCGPVVDRKACIEAICEQSETVADVLSAIERLFSDTPNDAKVRLASTHKAKGLETDRAFVLRHTYRPERGQEEENLLYVAITRAKRELVYVHNTDV